MIARRDFGLGSEEGSGSLIPSAEEQIVLRLELMETAMIKTLASTLLAGAFAAAFAGSALAGSGPCAKSNQTTASLGEQQTAQNASSSTTR